MNAESGVHPEGEVTPESMDDNLFGNAAPKPEVSACPVCSMYKVLNTNDRTTQPG